VSQQYLTAEGASTSADDPGAGVVTVYLNAEGIETKTSSIPKGFDGVNAKEDLLDLFGLPPRPAEPAALAEWLYMYVTTAVSSAPAKVCESDNRNSSVPSPFWAGHIDYGSGIKKASGVFVQPGFLAVCAHASAHATWSGLGGFNSSNLMQDGTASNGGLTEIYPWYEIYPLEPEQPGDTPVIHVGDHVQATTTWNPANLTAYFNILNVTTASSHTYLQGGSIVAPYYSGGTAEYIDERPANSGLQFPVDGDRYYYRKPNTPDAATHWLSQYTDGIASGNASWAPDGIYMQRPPPSGVVLSTAAVGANWSTHIWKACA
jgi:hypothetical protein